MVALGRLWAGCADRRSRNGKEYVKRAVAVALTVSSAVTGCFLVYPEATTPMRRVPDGQQAKPEPPQDLLYLRFAEVVIPDRTRDGRRWDAVGGSLPDPFARLIMGDKTVIVETHVERDTLVATWPDQVDANYMVPSNSKLRVEIWDDNALTNGPICIQHLSGLHEETEFGEVRLRCDNGTRIVLTVQKARARWGLGMSYEVGAGVARLTKVLKFSPVSRAGLSVDDEILALDGASIATMDPEQVTSAFNSKSRNGFKVKVRSAQGRIRELTLKEGPIYPAQDEMTLDGEIRSPVGQ